MTIAELIRDLFQSNKEKLKYPIFYTYLIILILWNWDMLSYYFISNSTIEEKIACIKSEYSGWSRVYYPFIYSVFISLLVPYLMFMLDWCLQWGNRKRKRIIYANNSLTRVEKLESARNEFLIEQEKTGKKDLEQLYQQVNEANQKLEIERKQNDDNKRFFEDTISGQNVLINDREEVNVKLSKDLNECLKLRSQAEKNNIKLLEEKENLEREYGVNDNQIKFILETVTGNKIGVDISYVALCIILEDIFMNGSIDQLKVINDIIRNLHENSNLKVDPIAVQEILRFFEEHKLIKSISYKKYLTPLGLSVYNHIRFNGLDVEFPF